MKLPNWIKQFSCNHQWRPSSIIIIHISKEEPRWEERKVLNVCVRCYKAEPKEPM